MQNHSTKAKHVSADSEFFFEHYNWPHILLAGMPEPVFNNNIPDILWDPSRRQCSDNGSGSSTHRLGHLVEIK